MITLQEILRQIDYLPVFNQTAQKVLELLRKEECSLKEVVETIKYDPTITANVLKVANSAYFAHTKEILDIQTAVNFLGKEYMYSVVSISAAKLYFESYIEGYESQTGQIWDHSLCVAVIAEYLQKLEPKINGGTFFTAGLLHDIGKIVLSHWVKDDFNLIYKLVTENKMNFFQAERRVLGYDHSSVGAAILRKWNFPTVFIDVARYHHDPHKYNLPVVRIVAFADYLTILLGFNSQRDSMSYSGYEPILSHYKIKSKDIELFLADTSILIDQILENRSN